MKFSFARSLDNVYYEDVLFSSKDQILKVYLDDVDDLGRHKVWNISSDIENYVYVDRFIKLLSPCRSNSQDDILISLLSSNSIDSQPSPISSNDGDECPEPMLTNENVPSAKNASDSEFNFSEPVIARFCVHHIDKVLIVRSPVLIYGDGQEHKVLLRQQLVSQILDKVIKEFGLRTKSAIKLYYRSLVKEMILINSDVDLSVQIKENANVHNLKILMRVDCD